MSRLVIRKEIWFDKLTMSGWFVRGSTMLRRITLINIMEMGEKGKEILSMFHREGGQSKLVKAYVHYWSPCSLSVSSQAVDFTSLSSMYLK
jgi:hypothetical protein